MILPVLIGGIVQIDPTEIEKEINMAKKKKQHIRLEFVYDKKKDETLILVWNGMILLDQLTLSGITSQYIKEKVLKEMSKRYEDE